MTYNSPPATMTVAGGFDCRAIVERLRFHLTMDTLAVRLTLPTTKRVMDFHHQAIAHGGRTTKSPPVKGGDSVW